MRFTAAEAVDDCASTRYCCGSAAGTYAGTLRCHLNLLPGNHEDGMIADMALLAAADDDQYQAGVSINSSRSWVAMPRRSNGTARTISLLGL